MKKFLTILATGIAIVSCSEKIITIKEFKENDSLRAEYIRKCGNENGFDTGSCKNAYIAEQQRKNEDIAKRRLKAAERRSKAAETDK